MVVFFVSVFVMFHVLFAYCSLNLWYIPARSRETQFRISFDHILIYSETSGLKNLNLTWPSYMHRKALPLLRHSRAIASSTVIVLASRYMIIGFKILDYFAVISIMEQYTDSESAQIGITTMFGIVVTIDLVGNSLVCLVILLYRDMR